MIDEFKDRCFREGDVLTARWIQVSKPRYMRGLPMLDRKDTLRGTDSDRGIRVKPKTSSFLDTQDPHVAISTLKQSLRWDDEIDMKTSPISLLKFSIFMDSLVCVRAVLENTVETIKRQLKRPDRQRRAIQRQLDDVGQKNVRVFGIKLMLSGCSNLLLSMAHASWEIVTLLLDAGATPDVKSSYGFHSLHMAAAMNRVDNIREWLKRFPSCDVDVTCMGGHTPLMVCCVRGGRRNKIETIQLLLESGANPIRVSTFGMNMLHFAAINWDISVDIMAYLIDRARERDPSVLDMDYMEREHVGITIFRTAVETLSAILTKRGINAVLSITRMWTKPMRSLRYMWAGGNIASIAACRGDPEMLRLYLEKGSNPLITNRHDETVSDVARKCENGHVINGVLMDHTLRLQSRGQKQEPAEA